MRHHSKAYIAQTHLFCKLLTVFLNSILSVLLLAHYNRFQSAPTSHFSQQGSVFHAKLFHGKLCNNIKSTNTGYIHQTRT